MQALPVAKKALPVAEEVGACARFQTEVMVWVARMANLAGLQTEVVIEVVVHDESLDSADERHGMGGYI